MEQNMEQYQRLRDYLNHTKGKRYPFKGHWLEDEDSYLQNAWLKMLCMVLQAARNISEEQTLFLQRLTAGIGAEYDVETYMRQGQEVTPEALEDFIELLLDGTKGDKDEKRYAFVLDALLLSHLGEVDEDAEELLAQVCEALRVTLEEMEAVAGLCADILRQDLPGSIFRAWQTTGIYNGFLWKPYLEENCGQTYKVTEDAIVAAQTDSGPFDLLKIGMSASASLNLPNNNGSCSRAPCILFKDRSYLYLRGLEISVNQHLYFDGISAVEFENCTFVGSDNPRTNTDMTSVIFSDCYQVWLTNCTFRDFKSRTIIAMRVPEIWVLDCSFTNCIRTYGRNSDDWKELGGVIYGDSEATKLYLRGSDFTNCGGENKDVFYASSVISNCRAKIESCRFQKCWHCFGNNRDPSDKRRCLFKHILSESNNELIDSAELGPH